MNDCWNKIVNYNSFTFFIKDELTVVFSCFLKKKNTDAILILLCFSNKDQHFYEDEEELPIEDKFEAKFPKIQHFQPTKKQMRMEKSEKKKKKKKKKKREERKKNKRQLMKRVNE